MSDLSLTIKLQDKLSAIVKKHEPKVIVVGSGRCESVIIAIRKVTDAFGVFAATNVFPETMVVMKTASCGLTQGTMIPMITKERHQELIERMDALNFGLIKLMETPDTTPKNFGMRKMGINSTRNFKGR